MQTKYDEEKCILISSIMEDGYIGIDNKEEIIEKFKSDLGISENEANYLYEVVDDIVLKMRIPLFRKFQLFLFLSKIICKH